MTTSGMHCYIADATVTCTSDDCDGLDQNVQVTVDTEPAEWTITWTCPHCGAETTEDA